VEGEDDHGQRQPRPQLTLLQVDLAPPPEDELKQVTGKNVPGSVEVKGQLERISGHWPATSPPNPNHLHIIVERASGASYSPRVVQLGECFIRLFAPAQDF
jgi:hypothetical protein